jgi:hypothetical protein
MNRDINQQQQQPINETNDNDVFDSILNATDRRMSWQQQRSTHKSFKPSLSVICKFLFLF